MTAMVQEKMTAMKELDMLIPIEPIVGKEVNDEQGQDVPPCMQGQGQGQGRPRGMIKVKSNANANARASEGPSFTILTYNVLAQVYATPEKHCLCPAWALGWEHRKQKLLTEIVEYDADIICLQEVQCNHFLEFFYPKLRKLGYEGVYKAKERARYSLATIDGCATFYRVDQFNLLQAEWINLSSYATYLPARFHKDNIALNVVLSFNKYSGGRRLCIANTHIHANPNNKDVKQWQVYHLLNRLESFVHTNWGAPLVICGDFNSTPGSAVHSLVTQGYVNSAHGDLDYDPYGVLQPADMFQHALPLISAYSSYFKCDVEEAEMVRKMDVDTGEPGFTNFSSDFQGTLDYIFHTQPNLKLLSLLELIDKDEVKKYGALPSPTRPSDHIALAAKFTYIISAPKSAF